MDKLLVILGPTATGKTDLALQLAKRYAGELVSVDSRQVYVGLDIGTGKLPGKGKWEVRRDKGFWEVGGIRVWMYDVVNSKIQYTVYDYVKDASRVIEDISKREKLPIIVGGTGLYLKALIDGLPNLGIPVDLKLRKNLGKLSLSQLQNQLQKLSPKRWQQMNGSDRSNPRRLIRAIEIATVVYKHATAVGKMSTVSNTLNQIDILKIGLTAPKEFLYEKNDRRVEEWIEEGIIDEVKRLIKYGIPKIRFKQLGLEYSMIIEYLNGKLSIAETVDKMKLKVRQYSKRQITWFKKEKNINWFDITDKQYQQKIAKMVTQWYD